MGYGVGKLDNAYSRTVLDVDASKTVWMAIAVSFAARIAGVDPGDPAVRQLVLEEWTVLHQNRIVPQRPRVDK